jgi:hypothetical protein
MPKEYALFGAIIEIVGLINWRKENWQTSSVFKDFII